MDPAILHLAREAVVVVLLLSSPPLVAALVVGLVTGVAQAATQVQEPTIGVVPRLVAVFAALTLAAPWIGARVARFAAECLATAGRLGP